MSIIYKYTSFVQGRYILRNNCLPLGHFVYYNDPYECNIGSLDYDSISSICANKDQTYLAEYLTDLIKSMAKEENWDFSYTESLIEMVAAFGVKILAPVNLLAAIAVFCGGFASAKALKSDKKRKITADDLVEFLPNVVDKLSRTYTSCFTTTNNNFLMWSHYADSHKGIVLGFNTESDPFKNNPPLPMDYSSKHYVFNSDGIKSNNIFDTVKKILLRKSDKWRDEHEHRFIFEIPELKKDDEKGNETSIVWYDHYDNPVIRLADTAIQSIYFGARVSMNNICQIKNIIEDLKRPKIDLYQCKLNKEKYSLDIVPLSTQ